MEATIIYILGFNPQPLNNILKFKARINFMRINGILHINEIKTRGAQINESVGKLFRKNFFSSSAIIRMVYKIFKNSSQGVLVVRV